MSDAPLGPEFAHVSYGLVKHVKIETTPVDGNTELLVHFWDRGVLVVRARFGEPLTIDVRPAALGELLRAPELSDAVVDAFLATAPPSDPARVARMRQRFDERSPGPTITDYYSLHEFGLPDKDEPPVGGFAVRPATDDEQRVAILRRVQQEIHNGTATHDCGDWRRGLICEVCGRWIG